MNFPMLCIKYNQFLWGDFLNSLFYNLSLSLDEISELKLGVGDGDKGVFLS